MRRAVAASAPPPVGDSAGDDAQAEAYDGKKGAELPQRQLRRIVDLVRQDEGQRDADQIDGKQEQQEERTDKIHTYLEIGVLEFARVSRPDLGLQQIMTVGRAV